MHWYVMYQRSLDGRSSNIKMNMLYNIALKEKKEAERLSLTTEGNKHCCTDLLHLCIRFEDIFVGITRVLTS